MFKSSTVFIVGAGASSEVGLPTGINLKSKIAEKLNIKYDFTEYYPLSGDWVIAEALRHQVKNSENQRSGINPYLFEAWKIHDAMPQAGSIDTYLDVHRGNIKMELCGKLAITRSILEAEKKSSIFYDPSTQKRMAFPDLENTWFNNFWRILVEGISRSEIDNLFDNVSFISFNYDRCIEHFLLDAIKNYYVVTDQKAIELVGKINIFHPYGKVGTLPGIGVAQSIVRFGEDIQDGLIFLKYQSKLRHSQNAYRMRKILIICVIY
jgi:hypothetical protein